MKTREEINVVYNSRKRQKNLNFEANEKKVDFENISL